MRELHLFSGAGGGILGGILLGHTCVCAVEIKPYRRAILLQRQRDGILSPFPIWDAVQTFDAKPWRGFIDVVCGGFPCQDISCANNSNGKQPGLTGQRSGLWKEMFRVVCEVRPPFVWVENSPALALRGLGTVLGNLASIGYDARWDVFSGSDIGAPHQRKRLFLLAYSNGIRRLKLDKNQSQRCASLNPQVFGPWRDLQDILQIPLGTVYPPAMRGLLRNDDGLAVGVDRISALGDGQIPAMVAFAWNTLMKHQP